MMHYGWNDGGWGIVWMIVSWGAIVALVTIAVRALRRDGVPNKPQRDAKDVLAERFAKGEIDAVEYHERLAVLGKTRSPNQST